MTPKTLDELLDHLPTLRRLRSLNAELLRVMLGREPKQCTWCGSAVPKGYRTWCSSECLKAFRIRCSPQETAHVIAARDQYRCQACGKECRHDHEIDHVVPVCEGGGLCGEQNLRTLCRDCHKQQTAELARRRRKRKN